MKQSHIEVLSGAKGQIGVGECVCVHARASRGARKVSMTIIQK